LWTVPIDIVRITAALTFDGATASGTGDATFEFRMGHTGNPIFDLRQTITAAWLDGAPLAVNKVVHHDFGGGADAELRIVEAVLKADSMHSLRLTYALGTPQASAAGSYQPAMAWGPGPRVAFNFGFTDLGAGRYLEAWIPANLIFDQFELVLNLRILNSTISHTVITNGTVTSLGLNQWRVSFPARFTALSPFLELRSNDSVSVATDTVTLPMSNANVTIEACKLADNPVDLPAQINRIKTFLTDNENSTGAYMHGNRFVAFFHVGGMEYEGGTTTDVGPLRHETFHSWWARGVKPASQPDAWFDEAWTVYNDHGASESQSFNFTDPPVTLCPRNPWVRVTAPGAYSQGYRFWKGVAAMLGVSTLNALMSEFYRQEQHQPTSSVEIEEFLIRKTGNPQLVDAFHRFIYGFGNPASAPDLWLRDDPADAGGDLWPGRFWDSPDLWIRNTDDGHTVHQPPEFGQDNWFCARVHNRGSETVRHFVVAFNVKQFAGTQFSYPGDFLPCVAAASGFELSPGASVIVKARWPRKLIPAAGVHACVLATVIAKGDHPITGRPVSQHNNLAQKNVTIVDLAPNSWFVLPFVVANSGSWGSRTFALQLIRPKARINLEVSLLHHNRSALKRVPDLSVEPFEHLPLAEDQSANMRLDCAGGEGLQEEAYRLDVPEPLTSARPQRLASQFQRGVEVRFPEGATPRVSIVIGPQEQLTFGLRLKVPSEAKKGETLHLDLIQRDPKTNRISGGIAIQINVA
jgi:hypothetical protein